MAEQKEPARYICKDFTKFTFRLGKTRHTFTNGQLFLTDETEIEELDSLLESNVSFSMKIFKVDKEAAEAFVQEQVKKNNLLKSGAVKGGVDSQAILSSQTSTQLQQRDAALSAMTQEQVEDLTDKLANDSDLILTEKQKNPVNSSVSKSDTFKSKQSLKEIKKG